MDEGTARLGSEFNKQTDAVAAKRNEQTTRDEKLRRVSGRLNITLTADARNRPEAPAAAERLATLVADEEKETSI